MTKSEWVKDYEGLYKISTDGVVTSYKYRRVKILKPGKVNGYLDVVLTKDYIQKHHYVHRLVAQAFICNSENKPQVNHKDGNKLNNNYTNLEWSTRVENMQHAITTGIHPNTYTSKVTLQFSLQGELLKKYSSASDACKELGVDVTALGACLAGKNKTAYGYKWQYEKGGV